MKTTPDYSTITVVLTPELAQRIVCAFGPDTEIGVKSPKELISEVDWNASNEIDIDEANPNRYSISYLQQYFETMMEDEFRAGNNISEISIRAMLNRIWRDLSTGKTKPEIPLNWIDREGLHSAGEYVAYGFTHDNREECAFTITLEQNGDESTVYELLFPSNGSPSGWCGINSYATIELAKADAEYHR